MPARAALRAETLSKMDHIDKKAIARTREQLRTQGETARIRDAQLKSAVERALHGVRAVAQDPLPRADIEAAKV